MSATFTLEIQLAPNVEKLLDKLIAALSPKTVTVNQQLPAQSPAEQATRMRMQPVPVSRPQQAAPAYAPQSNPTPAAPHGTPPMTGVAPAYTSGLNARTTAPVAPAYNQPTIQANPIPAPAVVPARSASPAGPSAVRPVAAPSNPAPTAPAPAYELDQLARGTSSLADSGKMQQINDLWQRFNIQRMDQLPKGRYGEYAMALRQLGVKI